VLSGCSCSHKAIQKKGRDLTPNLLCQTGVKVLVRLFRERVRPVVALYRFSCRVNRGDTGGVGDTEGVEAVRVLETDIKQPVTSLSYISASRRHNHSPNPHLLL
jgi:hypothetical protein